MSRVFFVAARLPFPLGGGPDFRTWMIAEAVARLNQVGVFGVAHRKQVDPPTGFESWNTASLEAALDHNVQGLGDGTWLKDPDWRPSAWYYHPVIENELNEELSAFEPDLVVVEQLGLAEYLPVIRKHVATVILNEHNVETDLQRQLAESETTPVAKMVRRQFANRTELLERHTLGLVDQVWVCSDVDRVLLLESFGLESVVVPNAIPTHKYEAMYVARSDLSARGPQLVFPAQFSYLPSENGALFLLNEILPAILESQPEASLVLPGRDPGPRLVEAARGLPVTVTGAVSTMDPYLESADIMVIPLREGGGTRLKALEAFAAGLPVISTAKGVEGLELEEGVHYLRAETADEFAAAARLVCEPGVAERVRRAAFDLVWAKHSPVAVGAAVGEALSVV